MRTHPHIPNWAAIDALAASLGVSRSARLKWRTRGVPYRWQIRLTVESKGSISLHDFPAPEGARQ